MLKMIHGREDNRLPVDREIIEIKDAAWPAPFRAGLEYNSPCHGPWNIVHIGMAVPQSHQIYVCGANCNRGVVLTAAEMQARDRYSTLTLYEEDLYNGTMEELIVEGVGEIIGRLPRKPRLIFLFTVCVHRFMGTDLDYVYRRLREAFPDILFVESSMEPISQKDGLTPEQRLREGMHSVLGCEKKDPGQVSIIGSDFPLEESSELKGMLAAAGCRVKESPSCRDLTDFRSMGNSSLFLCCYPTALHGVRSLSKRLDTPYLYLPAVFSYDEIDRQLVSLADALKNHIFSQTKQGPEEAEEARVRNSMPDTKELRNQCDQALAHLKGIIGHTAIALDATAFPRVLGLARLLLSHGFRVIRLYADAFSAEEREDFDWLTRHAPGLALCPTIHPGMRVFPRGQEEKVLAIGQKAAYFHQTPYFVNLVAGAGFHGYDGILRLTRLMEEAYYEEKDTRDLVGRKGWGCKSYG